MTFFSARRSLVAAYASGGAVNVIIEIARGGRVKDVIGRVHEIDHNGVDVGVDRDQYIYALTSVRVDERLGGAKKDGARAPIRRLEAPSVHGQGAVEQRAGRGPIDRVSSPVLALPRRAQNVQPKFTRKPSNDFVPALSKSIQSTL